MQRYYVKSSVIEAVQWENTPESYYLIANWTKEHTQNVMSGLAGDMLFVNDMSITPFHRLLLAPGDYLVRVAQYDGIAYFVAAKKSQFEEAYAALP